MLVVVVAGEIAEPLEFVVLPDLASAANAHQAEPVRAGENAVFGQLLHVGIDMNLAFDGVVQISLPQPEQTAQAQMHRGNGKRPATAGPQGIAQRCAASVA